MCFKYFFHFISRKDRGTHLESYLQTILFTKDSNLFKRQAQRLLQENFSVWLYAGNTAALHTMLLAHLILDLLKLQLAIALLTLFQSCVGLCRILGVGFLWFLSIVLVLCSSHAFLVCLVVRFFCLTLQFGHRILCILV